MALRSLPVVLTAALLAAPAAVAETVQLTLLNGDTINAELVPEESTDEVKVLVHPQLGRLEVSQDAIKPVEKPPAWTSTISGGINAGNKDGDGTFTANISGTSNYKSDTDRLKIQAGLNYSKNNDKGKPTEVKTDKGMANIRYDRFLNKTVTLYAKSDYQYNGLNDTGVNVVEGSVGVGFPLINTETTTLSLSLGPALHWNEGGNDCSSDEYCGNTYAVAASSPHSAGLRTNRSSSILITPCRPWRLMKSSRRIYSVPRSSSFSPSTAVCSPPLSLFPHTTV